MMMTAIAETLAQRVQAQQPARLASSTRPPTPTPRKAEWSELKRLVSLAGPEKKLIAIAVVFLMFSSAVSLSVPYGMGKIIDAVMDDQAESSLSDRSPITDDAAVAHQLL